MDESQKMIKRRDELQSQIQELQGKLKPLLEEKKVLNAEIKRLNQKIEREHRNKSPYQPKGYWYGYWNMSKSGPMAVYVGYSEKTYYTSILYHANGRPIGVQMSRKTILKKIDELKREGFTLVE